MRTSSAFSLGYKENNRLEAKRAQGGLPHSIWETSSAFANTFGGYILLGVIENAGKSFSSVPLPDPERLAADFWNGVNNRAVTNMNILSDRNVQIRESEGNRIVVIEVPRADRHDKPVYIGSDPFAGTYRRNGEGDYRCTREEALANALIHAGYYDRRGLVVQKWPDRIRITNPGAFRIDVQEALVGGVSDPRNVADQDVQSHQCERARRQRPAQHPRCLAEAALENAGDHREFRSRPYHAAAAVGLGKNGDKKAAIIRLHCRAAQSGNFAVPDRHAPGHGQRDRPGHRAAGVAHKAVPGRPYRRGGHRSRGCQQGPALPAEGVRKRGLPFDRFFCLAGGPWLFEMIFTP